MKREKKNIKSQINLTEGAIFKNIVIFALPIFMGTIVTQLYNVVDSMIVGRFVSKNALAAVSGSTPIMSIIALFMIGLSAGSGVVVAQRVGAGDKEALQKAVQTIACLTLICSTFITIVGLLVCKPLLSVLGTPPEIMSAAHSYLFIIYLGTTGNLMYQMGNGVLQGMGDSRWPFLFLLGCSLLNIVLDIVSVLILGWGVVGVAVATAVSQLVSGLGIVYHLNHGNYGIKLTFSDLRLDRKETKSIIAVGLPAAVQNVGNSIAALCVQSSVNFFGASFIAANSIVTRVDDMITIPVMALSTALGTFVGQNMGNLRMDRIKKGISSCIISLTVMGIGLCGILIVFSDVFPMIFTSDREIIGYASKGLVIMSFMCVFYGVDRCLVNAMRGAGKAIVPMITAQFSVFSRIPLAYYLGVYRNDYKGIFYAMLIAAFLRMAAIAFYYYGGGWKRAITKLQDNCE